MAQIESRLQDSLLLRQAALVLLALGVGVIGGLAVVMGNPVLPFIALAGALALPWLVTRPMASLLLVVATVMLLPFAVLPVRVIFTPTLLEIGLLFLYLAWALQALLNPGEGLARTPLNGWLPLLLGSTLFSFMLGLGRDHSPDVIHNYAKLILSIGVFFAVVNVVRTRERLVFAMRTLLVSGAAVAFAGAVLWLMPDATATGILTRLSVVGYPTDRVVRYIEDNPALGERAVGTQVDPNSFGGLLVVVVALTGVQLLARKPLLPRWLLAGMLLVDLAALVMTQSRTTFLAVVAVGVFVALLRYRKLLGWGLVAVVLVLALGVGRDYFGRIVSGLLFQDQANQMRLAEYQNALDIIGRYPVFGVGFGTAGELDLTTGASSVYLTVAERAGMVGLLLFLVVLVAFFAAMLPAVVASGKRAPPRGDDDAGWSMLDSILLGCTAAVLGAAIVGLADHYYFNIEFPHMAALLWIVVGLGLAALRESEAGNRKLITDARQQGGNLADGHDSTLPEPARARPL
jgi:O-antigen ligase